ncbi:uncharacterized protein LOC141900501 [Tubulanus polymorphus]|uniref:uncharacterized protein LOC141900501 n=1 Tax=Tubulanus polymorphus TaxID=672921 RepID=UPI003DA32A06
MKNVVNGFDRKVPFRRNRDDDDDVIKRKRRRSTSSSSPSDVMYLPLRRYFSSNRDYYLVILFTLLALMYLAYSFVVAKSAGSSSLVLSAEFILFERTSGGYLSVQPQFPLPNGARVKVILSDPNIIDTIETFVIPEFSTKSIFLPLQSKGKAGLCTITFKSKEKDLDDLYKLHVNVKVVQNIYLGYLSICIGWAYFLSWSISYYPQVYKNWKRRSVVGLSFDYLLLNIIGHVCYCIFNSFLYWNSYIQRAYFKMNPKSEIPVQANDNFFSIHAVMLTSTMILQCFLFDRGDQRISLSFMVLAAGMILIVFSGLLSALTKNITWLAYLYLLSYVKVGITPLKYIPQAYLNFIRQSTEGFAISGVFLDFSGSVLSLLQCTIDAYNSDDWNLLFGNPGKLGLAVIGMCFNVVFITQCYLYKGQAPRFRKNSTNKSNEQKLDVIANDLKLFPNKTRNIVHVI